MAEGKRQRSRRVVQNSRAKRVPDKTETVDGRKEKDVESGGEEEKVRCFCGEDREFGEMALFGVVSFSLYAFQRGRGSAGYEGFRVLLLSGIQNFVPFARSGGFEERGEGNAREKFSGEG